MVAYRVDNMTCGGCAARINRALEQLVGGAEVEISVSQRLVRARSEEATETELGAAIRDAGYTPAKVADAALRPRDGEELLLRRRLLQKADGSDTAQSGTR